MKLIVESGSTKSDSILISLQNKVVQRHTTPGINPVSDPNHLTAVRKLTEIYAKAAVKKIFYYGSGCINATINSRLAKNIMLDFKPGVQIEIQDDLYAVGRGLCHHEPGIVVILGTGSNIGYYDGKEITDRVKSSGYLLGDEGSGFRIGQVIYRKLIRGRFSDASSERIYERFDLRSKDLIEHLYLQDNPRRYLASYTMATADLTNKERSDVLDEVFDPFFDRMVIPLSKKYKVPIHLSGSISYHFAEELKDKFRKRSIIASSFEKSPIDGLRRYHSYE